MMSELRYAYGYISVSTHDQEEISPDSQENLLREYAARNNIVILRFSLTLESPAGKLKSVQASRRWSDLQRVLITR